MSKLIKKVLPLILTFIVSITIALLIGEFVIRMFYPQITSPVQFFYDEKLGGMVPVPNQKGFKNHPGVYYYEYQNNDIGMRDTRKLADYSKYANKILCLGDSFTYGWGVNDNETFTSVLEKKINKDSIAVLNAGVSGVGTDYALKFFQVRGKELAPKTVIYFYFDNDIRDNMANAYFHIENDSIIANDRNSYVSINALKKNKFVGSKLYNWLSSNSHLFSLIRHNVGIMWNKRVSEANQSPKTTSTTDNQASKESQKNSAKISSQKANETTAPQQTSQETLEHDLYHTYKYVSELDKEARKQGVNFLFFYIPANISIEEYEKSGKIAVENALSNYCKKNQIKFFSFKDETLKAKNPKEKYYLPVDLHWNKNGHALAADYLYTVLKQEKIIP